MANRVGQAKPFHPAVTAIGNFRSHRLPSSQIMWGYMIDRSSQHVLTRNWAISSLVYTMVCLW